MSATKEHHHNEIEKGSRQPLAEGETVYQKVLVKDAHESEITQDWIYVKRFDVWLKPIQLPPAPTKAPEKQLDAEAIEFALWLSESDWQFSREITGCLDRRAGNLLHGRILETIPIQKAYALFKESLTDNQ